ncbi:helix-turn-helix domain-containing protein [Parabacteroides sp.]
MSMMYQNEHSGCFNCDRSEKPQIEVKKIVKGDTGILSLKENEIVFVTEGRIRFVANDFSGCEGLKGQMLFLPAGGNYSFDALAHSTITVFRFYESIRLCDNFDLEKLYEERTKRNGYRAHTVRFGILDMNALLWHYLDGLNDLIAEGVRCRSFFNVKIKELLLLQRSFYTKEELHDFFSPILSGDTAFSEYIRLRWKNFRTVTEVASSMHMTHKQFYNRFVSVFGKKPQQWMNEGRARIIHNEIISTKKQFKQIAAENGFASDTHFTRFCKKELGKTPTEVRYGKTTMGDNVK